MMTETHNQNDTPEKDDLHRAADEPHVVFLIVAGVLSMLAAAAYFNEEAIIAFSDGDAMPFALLVVFLVLLSLVMVLCYRVPRIGNRLLGYDIVISDPDKKVNEGYHYTGTFKTETGADAKRQNTRRKSARASRKRMAAVTREMQEKGEIQPTPSKED